MSIDAPPRKLNRNRFIDKLYAEVGGPAARPGPPHEGQRAMHNSKARFRTSVWGRRAGKSYGGGSEITPRMFSNHSDGFPQIIWIVAPTFDLGEREYRIVHYQLSKLGVPMDWQYYTKGPGGRMALRTAWGAEVWVKSAERPDQGLLGEGLSFVIMAEAARIPRSVWEQYIEPALSDRDGSALFTSTPQGANYLKTFHDRGQNPEYPDWESWQFPSWVNTYRYPGGLHFFDRATNKVVPWQRVAAKPDLDVVVADNSNPKLQQSYRTLSRHFFWQEYGAQFRTQAGRVYPDFDEGYHVRPCPTVKGRRTFRTIDYGTTNPFVCLQIQIDEYGDMYVNREWRRVGHSTLENVQWVGKPGDDGLQLEACVGDPYEPDGRLTTENEWEIPCQFVTIGIKNGIELVQRRLKLVLHNDETERPSLYIDPSCTGLINEMQSYRWPETLDEEMFADGEFIVQDEKNPNDKAPLKANDHGPDGLRNFLAWYEGDTLVHHGEQDEMVGYNEDFEDRDTGPRSRWKDWFE